MRCNTTSSSFLPNKQPNNKAMCSQHAASLQRVEKKRPIAIHSSLQPNIINLKQPAALSLPKHIGPCTCNMQPTIQPAISYRMKLMIAAHTQHNSGPSSSYSAAHELSLQAATTSVYWCSPKQQREAAQEAF
ncbi:hypothetical protein Dimus_036323 [Dionaea muscipula]